MGPRAGRPRPSNLPAELTSFVGRRSELREVKQLLPTTRLLTLTGSGGAGKTRLALRAATEMARGFADGAWMVLLASVQDPMLVPQAVFGALGVHDLSAGLSLSSLAEYLAGRRLLLVLDNASTCWTAARRWPAPSSGPARTWASWPPAGSRWASSARSGWMCRRCHCPRSATTCRWSR